MDKPSAPCSSFNDLSLCCVSFSRHSSISQAFWVKPLEEALEDADAPKPPPSGRQFPWSISPLLQFSCWVVLGVSIPMKHRFIGAASTKTIYFAKEVDVLDIITMRSGRKARTDDDIFLQ